MHGGKGSQMIWCAAALCVPAGAALFAAGLRFIGLLFFCAALVLAAYGALDRLSENRAWARLGKHALLALLCLGFTAFLALESLVLRGAHSDELPDGATCVIVLGGGIRNGEPQPMLRARLDAALDCAGTLPDSVPVIVSGALDPGEPISEAEGMARYLIAHGLDEARIWKEDQATSTRTNFVCCYKLMAERGIDTTQPFVFVTSDFHVYRSKYLSGVPWAYAVAARAPAGASAAAHECSGYIREAFALANEFLRIGVDMDL